MGSKKKETGVVLSSGARTMRGRSRRRPVMADGSDRWQERSALAPAATQTDRRRLATHTHTHIQHGDAFSTQLVWRRSQK